MKHEDEFQLESQDRVWTDAFREAIHAESEQPAWFWSAQRAAIRGRISSRSRRSSVWMAFASVTALCLFALLLLSGGNTPTNVPASHPNQHIATGSTAPDKQTTEVQEMAAVQETIENPTPDSFAPLDLLAQDMDKEFKANKKLAKQ